jgi:hypothetical protein
MKASFGPRCKTAIVTGKMATKARKKAVLTQLMADFETL